MVSLAAIAVTSYLLGSVPTSILVARWHGDVDIRRHGSGNPGSTNVIRVLGWAPGLVVLAGDVGKGFLAAWLLSRLRVDAVALNVESVRLLAGLAVVVGHVWPIYASFRGGKGVATAAGVLLAVHPAALLLCGPVFAVIVLISRLVSLASMGAAVSLPLALLVLRWTSSEAVSGAFLGFAVVVALLIVFAHRSNIARLRAGTEERVRRRRSGTNSPI